MTKYKNPEIQIIKFEVDDILTASSGVSNNIPNIDGGIINFIDEWLKS